VQPLVLNADKTFTLSHLFADSGLYLVSVSVTDGHGVTGSDTLSVTVGNVAPTAVFTGPAEVPEGDTATVTFGGPSDPSAADLAAGLRYSYDFDGDGVWDLGDGTYSGSAVAASAAVPASLLGDGPTTLTVRGRVLDKDGGFTDHATVITVVNVAPQGVAITGAPDTGLEGSAISLAGTASDPAGANDTLMYAWSVTRNGTVYAAGTGAAFDFTPNDEGEYLVTLTVSDEDGGSTAVSRSVAVANVAPTATITGAPQVGFEGTAISLAGSFTDPGSADTHTLAWSVTRDGAPYASGSGPTVSFVPDDNGMYSVTFAVTDNAGASAADTVAIAVANVAPVASIAGAPEVSPVGVPIGLVGAVSDAGSTDTHLFAWAVNRNGNAYATGSGPDFSFTPDAGGNYVVALTVTDDDGGVGTDVRTIVVASAGNVAPTITVLAGPAGGVRGQTLAFSGAFTDPDVADAWAATVDFGDGSGVRPLTLNPDKTFAVNHTYTAAGAYTVTFTVTDGSGAAGTATRAVAVSTMAVQDDPHNPGASKLVIGGTTDADYITVTRGLLPGSYVASVFSPGPCGGGELTVGVFSPTAGGWHVELTAFGYTLTAFAASLTGPLGGVEVFAQAGNDNVRVSGSVGLPAWVYAGAGDDKVRGGGGHDVLLGEAGHDLLVGGGGRDVMIGGLGADRMVGDGADDILIAGTTAFDADVAALRVIQNTWTSSFSYETRATTLQAVLRVDGADATVFDDDARDVLTGSDGQDWFFVNVDDPGRVRDVVTDLSAVEFAEDLDFINVG
jgi:PKD repeat protein